MLSVCFSSCVKRGGFDIRDEIEEEAQLQHHDEVLVKFYIDLLTYFLCNYIMVNTNFTL